MIRELQMGMETYEILKDLLPSSFPNPTATVPLDHLFGLSEMLVQASLAFHYEGGGH